MKPERKFIDLKDLKMSDAGTGSVEGYRSVFGELDEGGDIVVKGAFADCMNEYLASGFSAHSHDWKFTEAVGYPVEAREDDYGWWVKSEFHSTQTAQDARTIASERKAAGKQVGFSFGYLPVEYEYIDAKDYKDRLPQYVKQDRLAANLAKAQRFNRIRLLKKVDAPEDSLVLAGMNKLAAATAVKDGIKIEIVESKGMLAEEMAQDDPSFWRVESAYCRVIRKIAESAKNAPAVGNEFDWEARVDAASAELAVEAAPIAKREIRDFLESTDDEFYLKGESVSGSFESFDDVVSALEKHTTKMQRNHENRVKEGRILSTSNRAKVVAARDALDELLTASEPPPPKEKADDSINVDALRTQSQRRHSQALAALAPS